jgi:hypothetical protein
MRKKEESRAARPKCVTNKGINYRATRSLSTTTSSLSVNS